MSKEQNPSFTCSECKTNFMIQGEYEVDRKFRISCPICRAILIIRTDKED